MYFWINMENILMFKMNSERESMYWDCNGSTFNFLNSPLQESVGHNPVMIVYDLF